MPEDINDSSFLQSADQIAENAAKADRARATLAAQNSPIKSSVVSPQSTDKSFKEENPEESLDKAFAETQVKSEIPDPGAVTKAPGLEKLDPAAPSEKPAEETEKADAASLDNLLAEAQATPAASEKKEEPSKGDAYEKHALAETASKKSRETFEQLKATARERENAAIARAEAAEAKLAETERVAKEAQAQVGKLTPEVEAELKELREHRAKFDREHDPEFRKRYDGKIGSNYDAIYGRLQSMGLPSTEIDKLKAFSPQVRKDNILNFLKVEGISEEAKLFIQSKLMSIASTEDDREQELFQAKATAEHSLKERAVQASQAKEEANRSVAEKVKPHFEKLELFRVKPIPESTPPEKKKVLEAQNAVAEQRRRDLYNAIVNDDVETRATAALSVPLAAHFAAENKALRARLAEAEGKLEKITKASATSRLSERSGTVQTKPAVVSLETNAGDEMDRLFNEATAGRAA